MIYPTPRFLPRYLFNKTSNRGISLEDVFRRNFKKDNILYYSQARIALLHFLKTVVPSNSLVATTSYTIFDIINVIISAGHKPYFVDIDPENLGPSISQLNTSLSDNNIKAVIFTHLHGYNIDIRELYDKCKNSGCLLIEDCAQSLWLKEWSENEYIPGLYSDAAIFSTGFFKNINTISGGLLLYRKDLINQSKLLKSYGKLNSNISIDYFKRTINALIFYVITNKFLFSLFTFNVLRAGVMYNLEIINKRAREENNPRYIKRKQNNILRMNLIQKQILINKRIDILTSDFYIKKKISELYLNGFFDLINSGYAFIPGVKIHDGKLLFTVESSFNQIPFICSDALNLVKFLTTNRIDIAMQHIRNLNDLSIFAKYRKRNLDNVNTIYNNVILLPCYPEYKKENVSFLIKKINQYFLSS